MKISFDVTGLRAGIGTKGTFNGSTLTLTFPKWFCHTPTKAEFPLATLKPQKPSFLSLSDFIFIALRWSFLLKRFSLPFLTIAICDITARWLTQPSNLVFAVKMERGLSASIRSTLWNANLENILEIPKTFPSCRETFALTWMWIEK